MKVAALAACLALVACGGATGLDDDTDIFIDCTGDDMTQGHGTGGSQWHEDFFPEDRFYQSTKLGNTVELTPDDVGNPIRILEPNIAELDSKRNYEAGAWVLTLRTVVPVPAALLVPIVNPLVALVGFGDGSVKTPVELDVANGASLQLPCGALQVDLILQAAPTGFAVPETQQVTASVHRGFSCAQGTRSFYLSNQTAGDLFFDGVVPTGTKGVRGYGGLLDAPVGPGGGVLNLDTGVAAGEIAEYSSTQMTTANATGVRLGVPTAAISWRAKLPPPGLAQNGLGIVEFLIQF